MPGNFGADSDILHAHEVFAELDDRRVLSDFIQHLGLRLSMENDGNSAALGEYLFGRQEHDGTLLSSFILAMAWAVASSPKGGHSQGHMAMQDCQGFLFPYGAPRPSALDLLETLQRDGKQVKDFSDILTVAPDDPILAHWCVRAGAQLRKAIRAATAFLDPSTIIIGGRLPVFVLELVVGAILAEPIAPPSRGLRIAPVRASSLGPLGGAIGAASLPLFSSLYVGARPDLGNPYLNGRSMPNAPDQVR